MKRKQTSEIVSCKSLPIGIVQNARPTIIRKQISAGDMIFLASDGVVDSYASINDFKSFVNDAKIYNLQKFTDDVIFDGQGIATKHIDDMSKLKDNTRFRGYAQMNPLNEYINEGFKMFEDMMNRIMEEVVTYTLVMQIKFAPPKTEEDKKDKKKVTL